MAWKDLSIAQRSQLMNIYRRAGITDLYRMKEMYDASSPSFPDGGNQMRIGNPYGNLYEEGGDKDTLKIKQQWSTKQSAEQASLDKYFKGFPYQKPVVYNDGYVQGIDDITDWVKDGYEGLYNKDFATSDYKYYKGKDGKIYRVANSENINTAGLTPMDYSELRKMLPKRDYIGGNDYRFKTMQRIPGFVDYVSQRAKAYGVDPNLILHRIGKEGWIDQIVQQYNGLNASQQNDSFWSGLWDLPVGGFGSFGLDDAGDNLMSGKYELLDPNARWEEWDAYNEKGRQVKSVRTDNLKSAIEIKAAEMAYRQREAAKKYGKSGRDLNIWTNAAFNMGLNHPKLADDDYIRRNYSYPDYLGASLQKKFGGILHAFDGGKDIQYYAKGGNIHIKPENRGKFTALKKRTGKSATWFKEHGTPAQKKMAVFALNSRKWKHADGGLLRRFDEGGDSGNGKTGFNLGDWVSRKASDLWYRMNISPKIKELGIDEVRNRLYRNISPYSYVDVSKRLKSALNNQLPEFEEFQKRHGEVIFPADRDDIFATYLQIPLEKRRWAGKNSDGSVSNNSPSRVVDSDYAPSVSSDNSQYKALTLNDLDKMRLVNLAIYGGDDISDYMVNKGNGLQLFPSYAKMQDVNRPPLSIGDNRVSTVLEKYFGPHTIGRGVDPERGEYISYYDKWDLAPFNGNGEDESRGIGKPIEFYDRIYLDDYFGVNSKNEPGTYYGGYLAPAEAIAFKSGGKIHIAPSKRGTFTAAATKHGKSVQAFASQVLANKENYSPEMVKKANFARNAAKWHADGGALDSPLVGIGVLMD